MGTPRYFGTDGLRGVANRGMLAPEKVLALGRALARLASRDVGRVALARDPRRSSPSIAAALCAGVTAEGGDVIDLGVLPTPGLAALLPALDVGLGVMVSASHNPMQDNGIKVLCGDGGKLASSDELWLEQQMEQVPGESAPTGSAVGGIRRLEKPVERYMDHLAGHFEDLRLDGMRVVVDGANGASSEAGVRLLSRLGAEVLPIYCEPDGININAGCGAVHPEKMAARVVAEGAQVGLALDGDGDRVILASSDGSIQDGDRILFVCAVQLHAGGKLADDVVVGTVMSNFGFELALRQMGVRLERTPVGDRHVAAALREHDWSLGGEQSGHLIFGAENGYVGDGLYSALKALAAMSATGSPLHELSSAFQPVPQILVNVPVRDKPPLDSLSRVRSSIVESEAELGQSGRIVVRYSGTENLLRVMVEGTDGQQVEELSGRIAGAVRAELGADPVSH